MPVKKTEDGQRSVEAEIEVPGTPEEVWKAIATGSGISSWFVPSEVEGREGGTTVTSFGPGMDSVAKITDWNPPKSFTAITEGEASEHGPGTVATEWIVEARDGGRCVVRVVHRWFADSDDWDGQFEGHAYGWAASFFLLLRLYLEQFPGEKCSPFQLTAFAAAPALETLHIIRGALGVDEATTAPFSSAPGTPELAGEVRRFEVTDPELLRIRGSSPHVVAALEAVKGEEPELFLELERPAPGLAHIMVIPMGEEQTMVSMRFHFYGDAGAAAAADSEREWQGWLAEKFPEQAGQG